MMRRELILTAMLIVVICALVVEYPPPYYIYIVHEVLFVLLGGWILSFFFPHAALEKGLTGCTLGFIIGVLMLSPLTALCIPDYAIESSDELTEHVDYLALTVGERPYQSESESIAARYIRSVLVQKGYDPQGSPNIVVEVEGIQKDVVLLCAHYDTVEGSPGADDNASGVSVLLETIIPPSPQHTMMLVFFTGEEGGLIESREYVQNLSCEVSAVVCVDTVGVGETLHISSMKHNRSTSFFLSQLIYGLSDEGTPSIGPLYSDHVPFNERGIPAVGLTRSTERTYTHIHSNQDTMVNEEMLVKTHATVQKIINHFSHRAYPYRGVYLSLCITCILSVGGAALLMYIMEIWAAKHSRSP